MKALLIAFGMLLAALLPAGAQDDSGPKVAARLVAEQTAVAPGGTITIALEEKIRDEWHTYWVNPGDAGEPSAIKWTLPPGWTAGAIQWPTPKRLPVLSLMDYGYEGKLWLLNQLTAPADAKAGDTVTLTAAVSWLVCKNICVPEDMLLSLPVTIGTPSPDPAVTKDFAAARALLPVTSPWKLTYARGENIDLYVAAPALTTARPDAAFFPLQSGTIKNSAKQLVGFADDGLVLRLTPGAKPPAGPLQGVLVLTSRDGSVQALQVEAPVGVVPPADFPSGDGMNVWLAMAFALLGGLILNAMPCVLPILAMKALALAQHRGAARESFAYSAGAVLSFVAFGAAVVALRAGGEAVGWGFQLQEPAAVGFFALLMFAVALNLIGLFEVGSVTAGDGLAARGGMTGAFFTGVLAVAVAAPCTAPFMAGALGYALTLNAASALAIFAALGVGFALPFLILGLWPRALSFMPKPGPWMLRLKQILALPMLAAAGWMAFVLWQQTGGGGLVVLAASATLILLAVFLWRIARRFGEARRLPAMAAVVLLVLVSGAALALMPASQPPQALKEGVPFTPEKLAELRAAKTPVFVDATAAWCITCLVNEQAVLSRANVKAAFAAKGVTYMVADWTNRNAAITKLLETNGRSGVPLYLYYAPNAETPVILPQILTEAGVLSAIGG